MEERIKGRAGLMMLKRREGGRIQEENKEWRER